MVTHSIHKATGLQSAGTPCFMVPPQFTGTIYSRAQARWKHKIQFAVSILVSATNLSNRVLTDRTSANQLSGKKWKWTTNNRSTWGKRLIPITLGQSH